MKSKGSSLTWRRARRDLGLNGVADEAALRRDWEEVVRRLIQLEGRAAEPQRGEWARQREGLQRALQVSQEGGVRGRAGGRWALWAAVVLGLGGLFFWAWQRFPYDPSVLPAATPGSPEAALMAKVEEALAGRRWEEARFHLAEWGELDHRPDLREDGERRVAAGLREEREQQRLFMQRQFREALQSARLEEARQRLGDWQKIGISAQELERAQRELKALKRRIHLDSLAERALAKVEKGQLEAASELLGELEREEPDHPDLTSVLERLTQAQREERERRERALALYQQAKERDQGRYDEEAVRLLSEALVLCEEAEIRALHEKMTSYGRVLSVPGDFPTLGEALQGARVNDRVRVAEGRYEEVVEVPAGVVLEGAGRGKTVLAPVVGEHPVCVIHGGEKATQVRGMSFAPQGLRPVSQRPAVVFVRGGKVVLEDCEVVGASGHGVAATGGAQFVMRECVVKASGWDGVSIFGVGTRARLEGVRAVQNFHHGIDVWEGAQGELENCEVWENGLSGVIFSGFGSPSRVVSLQAHGNREVGLLVEDGELEEVRGGTFEHNLQGGMLLQEGARVGHFGRNRIRKNQIAGVVVTADSVLPQGGANDISENEGRQVWSEAVFPKVMEAGVPEVPPAPQEP